MGDNRLNKYIFFKNHVTKYGSEEIYYIENAQDRQAFTCILMVSKTWGVLFQRWKNS